MNAIILREEKTRAEERDNGAVQLLDKGFRCPLHKALDDKIQVQRRLDKSQWRQP